MTTYLGESFVGEGADAAHINTVLGHRDGPVGAAWAGALASPSAGHVPFVAVVAPGIAVKPMTLFVSKAAIAGETHAALTWGAAQAGVAGGVCDAVADGTIPAEALDELVLIAAVWVNPAAADADAVYRNNREATYRALVNGRTNRPSPDEIAAHAARPTNPFYTAPEVPGP